MTGRRRLLTALALGLLVGSGCVRRADESGSGTARSNAPEHLDAPYVVLVALDGVGWDLMDREAMPNLERLAAAGARAERMIPIYPTKTFPTLYSIATGMYAENHGLVGNRFWAPDLAAAYALSDRASVEDGRFYRGEPIWVTAERQGMVAASFFFVGSEAPVGGVRPSYWYRFDAGVPHERRVDQVLAWLAMPVELRPHLVALYFEDVDAAWHDHGPDGDATLAALARVDASLGRLLVGIEALPHGDEVYVIVVSDHGLLEAPAEMAEELDMRLFPGVRLAETGPYASLFIEEGGAAREPGLRDSIAALLPESEVWLRADVPPRLHYSADPRVGDIVISAAPGRTVVAAGRRVRDTYTHGWDNAVEEMGAIFLAMGPGIEPGQRIPAFEAIHVYPFVARLLGLVPNAEADGRLDVLSPILAN